MFANIFKRVYFPLNAFNLFLVNFPFLYPLKVSENRRFFSSENCSYAFKIMSVGVFCYPHSDCFKPISGLYTSYLNHSTSRVQHLLGLCKTFSLGTRQWTWGSESCAFLNVLYITQKMILSDDETHQVWRHYFRAKILIFQKNDYNCNAKINCTFWDLLCSFHKMTLHEICYFSDNLARLLVTVWSNIH